VVVHAEGSLTAADVEYARRKVAAVRDLVRGPVLFTKVDVVVHEDPARERPVFAKAELDLSGRFVRAHATASTVPEAVDRLEDRLRERIERSVHRQEALHLRHRGDPLEWRHGDETEPRPAYFPRPTEEREVVRRKTFAVGALIPEEAALELEQLDHDFYLFTNARSGEDNVLHRVGEGRYELLQPSTASPDEHLDSSTSVSSISESPIRPSTLTVDDAIELLDASEDPFVFFVDPATGRGAVVYRRYDGHYGLIAAT
jgi:hypothetical protein